MTEEIDPSRLEFEDTFDDPSLDLAKWIPHYLPQWSSRERAAARYKVGDGSLRLQITEDQEPWCHDLDDDVRVSSLQTGLFAGPLGSRIGQHRFNPDAVVTEEQRNTRLYTPHYGRIELQAKALDDPYSMVALWLIGYEDEPARSGEICVCEMFGRDVLPDRASDRARRAPLRRPRPYRRLLGGDASHRRARVPRLCRRLDARAGLVLRGRGAMSGRFCRHPPIRCSSCSASTSSPHRGAEPPVGAYPKEFVVDYVRGYRLDA